MDIILLSEYNIFQLYYNFICFKIMKQVSFLNKPFLIDNNSLRKMKYVSYLGFKQAEMDHSHFTKFLKYYMQIAHWFFKY